MKAATNYLVCTAVGRDEAGQAWLDRCRTMPAGKITWDKVVVFWCVGRDSEIALS